MKPSPHEPIETVEAYLAALPPAQRALVSALRARIKPEMPDGFVEHIQYGLINYVIPLERSGPTYNGQPLVVLSLGAQKNHCAVYLQGVCSDPASRAWFVDAWTRAAKPLDMGKACVRFTREQDVALDVLAEAARRVTVDALLAMAPPAKKPSARKTPASKTPAKKSAAM